VVRIMSGVLVFLARVTWERGGYPRYEQRDPAWFFMLLPLLVFYFGDEAMSLRDGRCRLRCGASQPATHPSSLSLYIFSLRAWYLLHIRSHALYSTYTPVCVRACRSCGAGTCGVPFLGTPYSRPKWAMHQNRQCYPGHFLPPLESRAGWGGGVGGRFLPSVPCLAHQPTEKGEFSVTVVHATMVIVVCSRQGGQGGW
jgi:hypothetical protein